MAADSRKDYCKLFVRHLPNVLSNADKEDFFKHFGARSVICMGRSGKMRDTAFVEFPDDTTASKALRRLHQLEILGSALVVKYATKQQEQTAAQHSNRMSPKKEAASENSKDQQDVTSEMDKQNRIEHGIAPKLGLKYPGNPHLTYLYPPPTASILTNIAHTLACVPKFYTQVLHLMNKMNLPAPFGEVTPTPPIVGATVAPPSNAVPDEDVYLSSEESEIESDEEEKERRLKEQSMFGMQAKPKQDHATARKRTKLQPAKVPEPKKRKAPPKESQPFEEAFETSQVPQRKIAFNLTDAITSIFEAGPPFSDTQGTPGDSQQGSEGFGVFAPSQKQPEEKEEGEVDEPLLETNEFVSSRELKANRMSEKEIKAMSQFKNYSPGDPTSRLYVKNLSRQVEDKDLMYVFGRYVDFSVGEQKDRFDIRLMKEGRMKGQAFVTLPSEEKAKRALREVHGYMLHGKPIVIQFARSAKAKEAK
ncbi:RNA-binding region-containing protein 3 [Nematostella vectensis]|uniref:RNA-binding region-containing protein 3 n=1 Tax=Nematostella vectensis TaxID=45351 RepID=UPI0020777D75|nr:RNA-binding region-containing protein 3 [Nematostella vectensis]